VTQPVESHASARTLQDVLWARAASVPDATFLEFLHDGEVDGRRTRLSVGRLAERARAVAAALLEVVEPGDRALLLLPPGPTYVEALFGCFAAGVVAVPAYPPEAFRLPRTLPRIRAIADDADARAILVDASVHRLKEACVQRSPELGQAAWIDVESVPDALGAGFSPGPSSPRDLAYLQYTSGSTGRPKGVCLPHAQVIHNCGDVARMTPTDVKVEDIVSVLWLPPYHDLGLVGGLLQAMVVGYPIVTMAPHAFIRRPARWLQAIHHFRGTHSASPDFGLDLVVRKVSDQELEGLDLSSWRLLVDGAEPVRPDTLQRFVQRLSPHGLRDDVLLPAYGMAESVVLVAGAHPPEPIQVRRIDGRDRVGCGRPGPDTELRIVDPETLAVLAEDALGEVWVRGPGVGTGYHGRPELSEATFGARTADGSGPWLRTGDLGTLHQGMLFVTGRLKDLIVIRGRNLVPPDLEATVQAVHPSIQPGGVAAFSVDDGQAEQLVVVAELDPRATPPSDLDDQVRIALFEQHDVVPGALAFTHRGALPRTSSGKLQRFAAREQFLGEGFRDALPKAARTAPAPRRPLYGQLPQATQRADARGVAYQFDLEQDVRWHLLDAPGDTYPPQLAEWMGFDVDAVRAVPGAWQTMQWAGGMMIAGHFSQLERDLTAFLRDQRREIGDNRSIELLEEEELKHIALFERWMDHRARLRPDLVPTWERLYKELLFPQPAPVPQDRAGALEAHYRHWALTLFFEEFTLWFYERLRDEVDAVHPTWFDMHKLHAREEVQHMRTDRLWLQALDVDAATREQFATRLALQVELIWEGPVEVLRRIMHAFHPELQATSRAPFVSLLLGDRAFRLTRALGAPLAELAELAERGGREPMVRGRPTRAVDGSELRAWLRQAIAGRVGIEPDDVDPRLTFVALGLQSTDRIGLAGDLEAWLGAPVATALFFRYNSLDRVADVVLRDVRRAASRPQQDPSAAAHLGARAARLLDQCAAHPGDVRDHLTVAWSLPPGLPDDDLQRALHALVQRHPALRSRFVRADGTWRRSLDPDARLRLTRDASELSSVLARVEEQTYALDQAPLARAVRVGDRLVLGLHHAIADGWSIEVLRAELDRLLAGQTLPELQATPADLAAREPAGALALSRADWWRQALAGHPDLERPGRGHRTVVRTLGREVDAERVAAWRAATGDEHTLFDQMLAALARTWSRVTDSDDVLLGAHLHDRAAHAAQQVVDYRADILCARVDLAGCADLSAIAERTHVAWLDGLEHRLPVARVVDAVAPDKRDSRWIPPRIALNRLPARHAAQLVHPAGEAPPSWLPCDFVLVVADAADGGLHVRLWADAEVDATFETEELLEDWLDELDLAADIGPLAAFARWLGEPIVAGDADALDRPLASLGVDSLTAVELAASAEQILGRRVPAGAIDGAIGMREQLRRLRRMRVEPPLEIERTAQPSTALSPAERDLYGLVTQAVEPWHYGLLVPLRLVGHDDLDPERVQTALQALVLRHDALRTGFVGTPGSSQDPPRRQVHEHATFTLEVQDLRDLAPDALAAALVRERDELHHRPWDVSRPPLLTGKLLLTPDDPVLVLHAHHLVTDAWSLSVLGAEFDAILGFPPGPPQVLGMFLEPLEHRMGDIARTVAQVAQADPPSPASGPALPLDRERPDGDDSRGDRVILPLDTSILPDLDARCRELGVSRSTALLAAAEAVLVERGQGPVAYTLVREGRWRPDMKRIVGYLVGTELVLATRGSDESWSEHLQRVQRTVMRRPPPGEDYQLAHHPAAGRIILNPYPRMPFDPAQTRIRHAVDLLPPLALWDTHDLLWQTRPLGEQLVLDAVYRPSVLDRDSIMAMAERWMELVAEISGS